jgi:hypothetical protein
MDCMKSASSRRIDNLYRLVAALDQRSMAPRAVMELLHLSRSAARDYLHELEQAGMAYHDPDRHTVLRSNPDPQVRERFFGELVERLEQPQVALRRSASRHCTNSSGRFLHVLADDVRFPLVLHRDPVGRDPLVVALFGAAVATRDCGYARLDP